MTEHEAIKYLKDANRNNQMVGVLPKFDIGKRLIKALEEIQKYRAIGTPEKCRAAVEKQKAKTPIRNDKCTCPSCGTHNEVFKKRRNTVTHDIVYCWHCGQAVEIDRLEE